MDWSPKMIGGSVSAAAVIVGTLYSGGSWVETRYAHREDVELIGMQLQQHTQSEWVRQLQARIWQLEDRYGPGVKNAPESVKEEYRHLQAQLVEAMHKLDRVQERMEQLSK